MTEINIVPEEEYEEELADVFLLLVPIESLIPFELAANVRELLVYTFDFSFFTFTWNTKTISLTVNGREKWVYVVHTVSDIRNEDR